jgi:hypothetical protein
MPLPTRGASAAWCPGAPRALCHRSPGQKSVHLLNNVGCINSVTPAGQIANDCRNIPNQCGI